MTASDERWMRLALAGARRAAGRGEVPVGAVAVAGDTPVAAATNRMEAARDATAHAEMLCLRRASAVLRTWRLSDVTLYVTLEPCPMCASALVLARLGRLVYAAADPKKGADGSAYHLLEHPANNHRVRVTRGVLADEAAELLAGFFAGLRRPDPDAPLVT
ncbi:MAG TPA: tRNA adenosine(34) deaminase TadA [Candidatus Dormibacteraeota bacterium]|nr:tRNA adenosine(34) deaminase TadA [Candidatus Dormibacteraeota bacterium]